MKLSAQEKRRMIEIFGLDSVGTITHNVKSQEPVELGPVDPVLGAKVPIAQEAFSDSEVDMDGLDEEEFEREVEKEALQDRSAQRIVWQTRKGKELRLVIITDSSDSGSCRNFNFNAFVNDSFT